MQCCTRGLVVAVRRPVVTSLKSGCVLLVVMTSSIGGYEAIRVAELSRVQRLEQVLIHVCVFALAF